MIKERDLQEAIAECEGQRNPTASTCIKLAAFYTIRRELYGESLDEAAMPSGFSNAMAPVADGKPVLYNSGTPFAEAIAGKDMDGCLAVLDEMMEALQVLNPRLYDGVMRKLKEL